MPLRVSDRPESARSRRLSLPELIHRNIDISLLHGHILVGSKWDGDKVRPITRYLNEQDQHGQTALDVARGKANSAAVELLLKYGAKSGAEIY